MCCENRNRKIEILKGKRKFEKKNSLERTKDWTKIKV